MSKQQKSGRIRVGLAELNGKRYQMETNVRLSLLSELVLLKLLEQLKTLIERTAVFDIPTAIRNQTVQVVLSEVTSNLTGWKDWLDDVPNQLSSIRLRRISSAPEDFDLFRFYQRFPG